MKEESKAYETLDFALQAELRRFALEQGFEGCFVLHTFVNLHAGQQIIAAMHPPAGNAAFTLYQFEKLQNGKAKCIKLTRMDAVVDIIIRHWA